MQTMTLRGASEYLDIPKNRIWRAVKDGHLVAEEGRFKGQTALMVTKDNLENWAEKWLSPEEFQAFKHLQAPPKHFEAPADNGQAPRKYPEVPSRHLETPQEHLGVFEGVYEASQGASSHSEGVSNSEMSLREDLVGALERSHHELRLVERRAIELELQLRQHKMLLTENAESLVEREALIKEAEAKLQATETDRQSEVERLGLELTAAQAKEALAQEARARIEETEAAKSAELERLKGELESTRLQLLEAQKPTGLLSWLGLRKRRSSTSAVDKAV